MGQEILYCFKCQERVTSTDLEASNALRFGTRTACKRCVPDLLAGLTDKERKELVSKVQSGADPRSAAARSALSSSTPRPRTVPVPNVSGSGSGPPLAWALAGGAAVLAIVIVVVFLNAGTPPPMPPKPVSEYSRDRAAREALERAKNLPAADFEGQIAAWADALRLAEGTSYQREAKERHEGVLEMRRKSYAREIAVVEERAKALLQKEEFGAALAVFEAIRPLHGGEEWKGQLDGKIDQVRRSADDLYLDLRTKAAVAKGKGAELEVKAIRDRLSRWGLPEKGTDLEAHLRTITASVEERAWTPLFDGKSTDFLVKNGEGAWIVENGFLVRLKDKKLSAQTLRQFSDGEFLIRFKFQQLQHLGFNFRLSEGFSRVQWDGAELAKVGDGEHELLISFFGNVMKAQLDGKPWKVETRGTSFKGSLQFNAYGEYFGIRRLDFREPGLADGLAGHWSFDLVQGGKVPDASPNRNDGTIVGEAEVIPGRLGQALKFDGRKSHVMVSPHPSLDLKGPLTLSAWVKPAGPGNILPSWKRGTRRNRTP